MRTLVVVKLIRPGAGRGPARPARPRRRRSRCSTPSTIRCSSAASTPSSRDRAPRRARARRGTAPVDPAAPLRTLARRSAPAARPAAPRRGPLHGGEGYVHLDVKPSNIIMSGPAAPDRPQHRPLARAQRPTRRADRYRRLHGARAVPPHPGSGRPAGRRLGQSARRSTEPWSASCPTPTATRTPPTRSPAGRSCASPPRPLPPSLPRELAAPILDCLRLRTRRPPARRAPSPIASSRCSKISPSSALAAPQAAPATASALPAVGAPVVCSKTRRQAGVWSRSRSTWSRTWRIRRAEISMPWRSAISR